MKTRSQTAAPIQARGSGGDSVSQSVPQEEHAPKVVRQYGTRKGVQKSQAVREMGIDERSQDRPPNTTTKSSSTKQDRRAEGMRKLAKLAAQRRADDEAEQEYLDAPHAPCTSSQRVQPVGRVHGGQLLVDKDQSSQLRRGAEQQQYRIRTGARDVPEQPRSTGRSHNQPPNRPFNLASSSDSDNQLGQALANVRKLRRKLNQIAKNPTQPRSPTPPSERLAHFTIRIPPKALERFRRAQDARLKQRSAKAQTGDNGDSDSQLEDETLLDADRNLGGFSFQHSQKSATDVNADVDMDASDAQAVANLHASDADDSDFDESTFKDACANDNSDSEHGSNAAGARFGYLSVHSASDDILDNTRPASDSEPTHGRDDSLNGDQEGYASSRNSFGSPYRGIRVGGMHGGFVSSHHTSDSEAHRVDHHPDAGLSDLEYHGENELNDFDSQGPGPDEPGMPALANDSDFDEFERQHSYDNWQPDEDFDTYYAFEQHNKPSDDPGEDTEYESPVDTVLSADHTKARSRRRKQRDRAPSHSQSNDSEEEEPEPQPRKSGAKCLSAAQRKQSKRAEVRREIEAYSQTTSIRKTTKRRRESRSPSPNPSRSKKGKGSNYDVFRPDWKKVAKEREALPGTRQSSKPAATQARGRSNHTTAGNTRHTSKTARGTVRRRTASKRHWQNCVQSDASTVSENDNPDSSDDGGDRHARVAFTDADVAVTRTYAATAAAQRSQKNVRVEALDDDDASETERTGRKPRSKRPRRSPSEISEDKSRSAHNVPAFIKPVLAVKIIPTVLDYFGAKKYPWNLQEQGRTELLDLCQELIDEACPRMDYELTKTDIIYKVIRQAVYDWRAGFANAAVSAVMTAIDDKFGPKPGRKIVKLWVRKATSDGGESLWAKPHANPERARGALQSKYVLKSFAHHLIATTGSMHDYGYPRGALALAATAVQHIFPMFVSGSFKAGKSFSAANVEHLTNSWYRKRVRRFSKKPQNFAVLVRRAGKYVEASRARKVPAGAPDVPDFFDRSSSPVRDDDGNDDDDGDGSD